MNPIEILIDEHKNVMRLLRTIELAEEAIENGCEFPAEMYRDILHFASEYADRLHHFKEEDQLFPVLEKHNDLQLNKVIDSMKRDHVRARSLITTCHDQLDFVEAGDGSAKDDARYTMMTYAILLRNHINKEDNVLFAAAARIMPPEELEQLQQDFQQAEQQDTCPKTTAKLLELLEKIENEAANLK